MDAFNKSMIECSTINECYALNFGVNQSTFQFIETYLKIPIYLVIILISFCGAVLNLICFIALRECTCEFNKFLSIFTMNSLIFNANDLLTYVMKWSTASVAFGFDFFCVTVFSPVAMICFTFGSYLDILIMFERLQLFIKRLRVFSKLTARQWSAIFFAICLFLVVPIILSRKPVKTLASIDNTTSLELYKTNVNDFNGNTYYLVSYYFSIFMRDVFPLFLEISLNVLLYIKLKFYLQKKSLLLAKNKQPSKAIIKNFKKCDENNTRLAILMCLLSAATHLLALLHYIALWHGDYVYSFLTNEVYTIACSLKHAINIFIFYKFNKIFKLYFRKSILRINENMTELDRLF